MNSEELLERFIKIREDPLFFLSAVRTLDESNKLNPIRRFPVDLDYIKLFVKIWQNEKAMLVPKSRRMRFTWISIALHVWDTTFNIGRHCACVSKKEDDADFLIRERAKFILDNLDPEIIPRELVPKYKYTYNLLEFPEMHSKIQGFPQGADQARQYTLSSMFADEFAFWDKAEQTYASAKPCLEGGGRFTGVSSPAPGFFKRMVLDKIDDATSASLDRAYSLITKKKPMHGVEIWRNPKNGFMVFQVHYTADPDKRSPEWKRNASSGIPIKHWMQEYELAWDTYAGTPVYSDFKKEIHVSKEKIYPQLGLPLLRGWDFGLTPACVICQVMDKTVYVLKEFTATNMGIDKFSDIVLAQIRTIYPMWADKKNDWMDFIDPSGFFRKDTDETSCAEILGKKVGNLIPGEVTWEKRRKSVEDLLVKISHGQGCLVLNDGECPVIQRGFEGGYRYPEGVLELEPSKIRPIKDEHSHPHDALQMITCRIFENHNQVRIKVPSTSYSWQNRQNDGPPRMLR